MTSGGRRRALNSRSSTATNTIGTPGNSSSRCSSAKSRPDDRPVITRSTFRPAYFCRSSETWAWLNSEFPSREVSTYSLRISTGPGDSPAKVERMAPLTRTMPGAPSLSFG